jgi:hypothetical protein
MIDHASKNLKIFALFLGHASIASYMTQTRLTGFHVKMDTGEGGCLYFSFYQKRGTLDSTFFEVPETIIQQKCCNFSNIILLGILFIQLNPLTSSVIQLYIKYQAERRNRFDTQQLFFLCF